MPRAFDIAAATTSASLDSAGKGEATFKVTNALGARARVHVRAIPEGTAGERWLTVDAPEKDLEADATATFLVRIAVPARTPPGGYAFHLLAASVANPDDEFTEGPSVSFAVAPAPAEPPKPPFPWWIVAVAASVIVVGSVVAYVLVPGRGRLRESCGDRECEEHLTCVRRGETSTCLVAAGYGCSDAGDCVSGRCDGRKCVEVPLLTECKAAAECDGRQLCVAATDVARYCLFKGGERCRSDLECASLDCSTSGTCTEIDKDKCKPGLVWREATPTDHVCVSPERRAAVGRERTILPVAAITQQKCQGFFAWRSIEGAGLCVWRGEAQIAHEENKAAASRRLLP